MGSYKNWVAAKGRVECVRAVDSTKIIKRIQKQGQERLKRLTEAIADPDFINNPRKFHEKKLAEAKADPQVATIYKKIREALWNWPEFAGLSPGARHILETVIELAREEAFPWFVLVPAKEVRNLARLSHPGFVKCAQEIELLAISREATIFSIRDDNDGPDWDAYMKQSALTDDSKMKAPTYLTYNDVDFSVINGKSEILRNFSRADDEENGNCRSSIVVFVVYQCRSGAVGH